MKRVLALILAVGALVAAGCGGDGGASPGETDADLPPDIAASVRSLGGDPASALTVVTPGKVWKTPNGYLYGYCEEIQNPKQTITANICTDAPR